MDREKIIEALAELMEEESSVHALWLEGADAAGNVDVFGRANTTFVRGDKIDACKVLFYR